MIRVVEVMEVIEVVEVHGLTARAKRAEDFSTTPEPLPPDAGSFASHWRSWRRRPDGRWSCEEAA